MLDYNYVRWKNWYLHGLYDIVNNLSRWIILYELLIMGFRPFDTAILSSIAA